jgi:hypothetical protein
MDDSLLDILREDVKRAPSGRKAERIAALLGKGYSTLMNELNGAIPGHKFGVLQLIPVMEATGSLRPLDYLAGAMGAVVVRLPGAGRGHPTTERDAVAAVREFGELMAAVGSALDDGRIGRDERRRIVREGYEALQAIMTLLRRVEEMRDER